MTAAVTAPIITVPAAAADWPVLDDSPQPAARQSRHDRTDQLLHQLVEASTVDQRRRLAGDVVLIHRGVARSVAGRYRGRGVDLDDLEQLACLGMMKAALRWQPGLCADFLQFAVPTMTGEIKRHFRDRVGMVRPPRRLQELRSRLAEADRNETPTVGTADRALAARLHVPVRDVREARQTVGITHPSSLDQSSPSGVAIADVIGGEDQQILHVENRMTVETLMAGLPERARRIVHLRFVENLSQREIGDRIGVSQMQVSRLLRAALNSLRGALAA